MKKNTSTNRFDGARIFNLIDNLYKFCNCHSWKLADFFIEKFYVAFSLNRVDPDIS